MKKIILHNFGLKITTFICAFIFWQLITGIADPIVTETYREIPVTMLNEEIVTNQGKVYQVIDGNTVSIVVKGKTSILREIKKEDIVAVADFESLELSTLIPIDVTVSGLSKAEIEATANPNNLKVTIEDSASKKFPITAASVGEVAEGYVLGDLAVQTETVAISGPASIVDTIVRVEARVNVDGIKENGAIDSELVYYDEKNLAIEQTLLSNELTEAVLVNVQVYATKTLPLKWDTVGNPVDGYEVVEITAEPYEVVVYGKDDVLENYDEFVVNKKALDVTGLSGKVEKIVDLLEYLPEDLELLDRGASSVAVTIQIDEYGTKSIEVPVQSITVHNNPTGLNLEYHGITDLMLTFTGKDKVMDELSTDDIRLSIDLKTYDKAGEYKVEVHVVTIEGAQLTNRVQVPIKLTKSE